jgi:hypothetical protein
MARRFDPTTVGCKAPKNPNLVLSDDDFRHCEYDYCSATKPVIRPVNVKRATYNSGQGLYNGLTPFFVATHSGLGTSVETQLTREHLRTGGVL